MATKHAEKLYEIWDGPATTGPLGPERSLTLVDSETDEALQGSLGGPRELILTFLARSAEEAETRWLQESLAGSGLESLRLVRESVSLDKRKEAN